MKDNKIDQFLSRPFHLQTNHKPPAKSMNLFEDIGFHSTMIESDLEPNIMFSSAGKIKRNEQNIRTNSTIKFLFLLNAVQITRPKSTKNQGESALNGIIIKHLRFCVKLRIK